jgi:hypothetical protein
MSLRPFQAKLDPISKAKIKTKRRGGFSSKGRMLGKG